MKLTAIMPLSFDLSITVWTKSKDKPVYQVNYTWPEKTVTQAGMSKPEGKYNVRDSKGRFVKKDKKVRVKRAEDGIIHIQNNRLPEVLRKITKHK